MHVEHCGRPKPKDARLVVTGPGWPKAEQDAIDHFQRMTDPWLLSPSFMEYARRVEEVSGITLPFSSCPQG